MKTQEAKRADELGIEIVKLRTGLCLVDRNRYESFVCGKTQLGKALDFFMKNKRLPKDGASV
ncbi:hypothetical protein [Gulbenkiania mobilis]|uniref:hypothetical protein n=1 Tax=Gulbenkiania mobilis TaxID=397457 RepID=UPI00128EB489|nr:hypothetical protein [Gulbenkiania mobilis]